MGGTLAGGGRDPLIGRAGPADPPGGSVRRAASNGLSYTRAYANLLWMPGQHRQIVRGALRSGFLGYGVVAAHAGRGYMTEGTQLVLARAFSELRLHRLEANVQPGNRASIALVRRCGFVREGLSERYPKLGGQWRDHERWAIRAEQWLDQNDRA